MRLGSAFSLAKFLSVGISRSYPNSESVPNRFTTMDKSIVASFNLNFVGNGSPAMPGSVRTKSPGSSDPLRLLVRKPIIASPRPLYSIDDRMTAGRLLVWLRSVKGKGTSTTSHLSKFVIDRIVLIIPFRKA